MQYSEEMNGVDVSLTLKQGLVVDFIKEYDFQPKKGAYSANMLEVFTSNPFYNAGVIIKNNKELIKCVEDAKQSILAQKEKDRSERKEVIRGIEAVRFKNKTVRMPKGILFIKEMQCGVWLLASINGIEKSLELGDILANEIGNGENVPVFLEDQAKRLRQLASTYEIIAMAMKGDLQ
jgi:hypothetical protein